MKNARPGTLLAPWRPAASRRFLALALAAQLLLLPTGCSPLTSSRVSPKWMWWKQQDEPVVPKKMTPMWTDTVLYQTGLAPVRGFGGRVMFFDGKQDKPVEVEGTLTVYAFDGSTPDSSGLVPERKFVFPAEELEKHYSESKLGASYSFWLPWDEVGGVERQITLITRFEPTSGGPVMSQPSRHYLPGLPAPQPPELVDKNRGIKKETRIAETMRHPVQAASFTDAPIDPTVYPRMSTVTIDVPPSFIRHTQGDPLEQLRERMGGSSRIETRSDRRAAVRRWWEHREEAEQEETTPPPSEVGEEQASTPSGPEAASGGGRRREQIRRRPHQANWIAPLPPTPRSEWARTAPDRWPRTTDHEPRTTDN
jgi:hypothetical protein